MTQYDDRNPPPIEELLEGPDGPDSAEQIILADTRDETAEEKLARLGVKALAYPINLRAPRPKPQHFDSWRQDQKDAWELEEAARTASPKPCVSAGYPKRGATTTGAAPEKGLDDTPPTPLTRQSAPAPLPAKGNGAAIGSVGATQDERAVIDGVEKRVTTMKSLNARFAILQTAGAASAYVSRHDFQPIQDTDLKRRLVPEVVITGHKDGRPVYKSAFVVWTGNASRHVYRRVAFTSEPAPADTYNLYRGLGVKPKPGNCRLILKHIEEVICAGDKDVATAMINLMAWQLQNIGKPSRVVVILKSAGQQAGKGVLLGEVMAKIFGPGSFVPSTMDQVLGRFNDAIRGCAFVFLDEVLFAGDRRAADAIKSLSTCTEMGIETKGLPIVKCPIAVNLWLASNHDAAAHIEEHDARYWVLNVSEHRVGDAGYFAALMKEIESDGREAFAHYLLNLDVSNFVPSRDIKKDTQAKRDMIRESINAYDARNWIEDCCKAGSLFGRKAADGGWVTWVAGDEYSLAALSAAYIEWQRTVKSPVAPIPTRVGALGEVLTKAEFGVRRTSSNNVRVLPPTEECLRALWRA